MNTQTLINQNPDADTIGGRISRAREAVNMEPSEAAVRIGVTQATYDNWENDRDEPRANKLVMLAGVISVSPAWLLHGVGESPSFESIADEVSNLKAQLLRLKTSHEETESAIEMIEQAVDRLAKGKE
jgi:transcriptional regulator with XRE-family HTH domain